MTAPNIPDAISRDEILALCRSLGLDPYTVMSLEIGVHGIYVTYYATDSEGHKMSDGPDVAKHRIYVPIVDDATKP